MEAVEGQRVQKLMSLVRTAMSYWRWVLMAKAWICLSSARDEHLDMKESGVLGLDFG